jgi:hypothetical protein
MLDGGATAEEVVRDVRTQGFSVIEATFVLMTAAGLSYAEAMQGVVLGSPICADRRAAFDRWIEPPAALDEDTLDRLRKVCRGEPRIVEAWLTGTRFTRSDGSWSEGTDIALILEPAFQAEPQSEAQIEEEDELAERLLEAAVIGVPGNWFFVTKEILEAHAERCIQIYTRAPGRDEA